MKNLLERIPWSLVAIAYIGIGIGFLDLYPFFEGDDSPLKKKQAEVQDLDLELAALRKKVQSGREFVASLEQKKSDLRKLVGELAEMKGSISDETDIPAFITMISTEAKKVGLMVLGIQPQAPKHSEYYDEQPFDLEVRGVYVQLLVLLERLANTQHIVRIENLELKPVGSQTARFVELVGKLQVKTFRYAKGKADEIGARK